MMGLPRGGNAFDDQCQTRLGREEWLALKKNTPANIDQLLEQSE
jgi:hypothetical protein